MARCEPHDLELGDCADCRPRAVTARPAQALAPDPGPFFTAEYRGTCAGCAEDIEPGDAIRANGRGRYLCQDCGEAEEAFREAAPLPPPLTRVPRAATVIRREYVAPFETGEPWRGPAQADWDESRGY